MIGSLIARGTHEGAALLSAHAALSTLRAVAVAVLLFFFLANTGRLVLAVFAALELSQHRRTDHDDAYASPLTPSVSVVMVVGDAGASVAEATRAALALRHPSFEVVVVDDGPGDATFEGLRAEYDLVEVPWALPGVAVNRRPVTSVHLPRDRDTPLLVARMIRGGRADALNVGITLARNPLVCLVEPACLLDPQALLTAGRPFAEDPLRVVAVSGALRPANGCPVLAGRVVDARMPRRFLPLVQAVGYLRTFLLERGGLSRLRGLVTISGSFTVFRRDAVIAVGGLDPAAQSAVTDLTVRLHRRMRDEGRDYRIVCVTEPVAWAPAPTRLADLAAQRRRWAHALAAVLWRHHELIANPAYGRIGLAALPYLVTWHLLASAAELVGPALVGLAVATGAVDLAFGGQFMIVAYGYLLVVTSVALAVEWLAHRRYRRKRDLGVALAAAVGECLGFRQLTAWWQVQGSWAAVRERLRPRVAERGPV